MTEREYDRIKAAFAGLGKGASEMAIAKLIAEKQLEVEAVRIHVAAAYQPAKKAKK